MLVLPKLRFPLYISYKTKLSCPVSATCGHQLFNMCRYVKGRKKGSEKGAKGIRQATKAHNGYKASDFVLIWDSAHKFSF